MHHQDTQGIGIWAGSPIQGGLGKILEPDTLKVIELFNAPALKGRPLPLVVGVPVGFVKAVESKALLATQDFPFITALGRKGGTPVAVAIVNALLKMAGEK